MASTVTFTSCIDNDEPAGIENLRGAKAELLRAKVAVEQAQATYKLAEAEKEKAAATYKLAEARYKEAEAKKLEAEAAQAEAKTEADKAYYAQQAAYYKNLMEEQAETHKATMVQKQQAYAEAVRAYEVALKQIEIAKALMSDKEKVSIESLQAIIEGGSYTITNGNTSTTVIIRQNESLKYKLEQAISEVESKEEALYNAMMEKAQYGSWTDANGFHQYEQINKLELELSRAKAELEAAKEAEANLKDALSQDTETLNWKAEIEELEDSIAGLDVLKAEYDIKIAKLVNSDEFKAAKQAASDAVDALTSTETTEEYKYVFKFNSTESGENTVGNSYWEVKVDKGVVICDDINPDLSGTGTALKTLNDAKTDIKTKLAAYTTEKQAMLDEYAADAEGAVETAKKNYDAAVKAWKAAIEKYDKAKDYKGGTGTGSEYATVMKAIDDNWANTYAGDADVESGAKSKIATALATYYTNAAVVDLVTNEVQVTMGGQNVKKTVLAFLSDADYKVAYLNLLAKKFNNNTDFAFNAGSKNNFKQWFVTENGNSYAIKSMSEVGNLNTIDPTTIDVNMTSPNISQQLVIASKNAFGTALLTESPSEKYMRVEPTAEEVKDRGYDICGFAGKYYQVNDPAYKFTAKNYKDIMADYKAAIESIDAEIEKIKETLADLKTAAEEAAAAFQEYKDAKKALQTEKAGVTARITALGKVKAALLKAFGAIEGDSNGDLTIPGHSGPVSIDEYLQYCVEEAEDAVITAEKTVAEAEVDLQKAKDGKYDGVATAQKALDKANEKLQAAQAAYDKAVADLKTALEIMAKSAE